MKNFSAIAAASMCLLALTPAHAEVRYPAVPCRLFVDTDWVQIPNQCGSGNLMRWYPRRLFLPPVRRSFFHGPYD